MKKVYIAGPGVFAGLDTLRARETEKKNILSSKGFAPLYPLDNEIKVDANEPPSVTAMKIRTANIAMIDDSDVVIADITMFRGHGSDPGTTFEIGYATGRGIPVILFWNKKCGWPRIYKDRVCESGEFIENVGGYLTDCNGAIIEDFGLPDNLMYGVGYPICDSFEEAVNFLVTLRSLYPSTPDETGYHDWTMMSGQNSYKFTRLWCNQQKAWRFGDIYRTPLQLMESREADSIITYDIVPHRIH